jgi:[acyl-carrier-protein] S-malonyltransferase
VRYAVIFPGQGAAAPGAGRAWADDPAWDVVGQAEAVLDRPVARLLLEADAAELAATGASQLAVLLASLVAWEALAPRLDEAPVAFAGHSLGQITALLAAGAVDRSDGLRLAARRADLSQASADTRPGGMAALVGVELDVAARVCEGAADVWIANDNAPGQVVIAGTPQGLAAAGERARQLGVRRVMALDVGHAFHTPLLADAAAGLRPFLEGLAFQAGTPVVANTDALGHTDPHCWPDQLTRHLVEPVRWRESQRTLAASGATTFIEVGPGRILAGLAKRTVPDVTVLNVTTPDDLSDLLATNTLAGATP